MNGELLFLLYLPSSDQEPTFEDFLNEISIRRFLPFTDCFFLLTVVSFCFHAPRDSLQSIRLLLYRSQLIKKLAHANNKVSTLISNRATSVKVTRK